MLSRIALIASTAAWSAAFSSPRPISLADAMAAVSVTYKFKSKVSIHKFLGDDLKPMNYSDREGDFKGMILFFNGLAF